MSKKIWVAGRFTDNAEMEFHWGILGVFDSETKAIAACETSRDFIGPLGLNKEIEGKWLKWPGQYYPFAVSQVQ